MDYRDELTAAYQQIEALKSRIKSGESTANEAGQSRLEEENAQLKLELKARQLEFSQLQKKNTTLQEENRRIEGVQKDTLKTNSLLQQENQQLKKDTSHKTNEGPAGTSHADQEMQTADNHNRSRPLLFTHKKKAGVLCPRCYSCAALQEDGGMGPDRVEMVEGMMTLSNIAQGIICPKCLHSDYKKL